MPPFTKWPFVLRALVDPIRAFDLVDRYEHPDHTKIIPFFTLVAVLTLKYLAVPFTVLELTVLFSAAFGLSAWKMFLRQRTVTGVGMDQNTVVRTIVERRDPELGVDPTLE